MKKKQHFFDVIFFSFLKLKKKKGHPDIRTRPSFLYLFSISPYKQFKILNNLFSIYKIFIRSFHRTICCRSPRHSNLVIQLYPCQMFYVGLNLHFILKFQTTHQVEWPSRASRLSFDWTQVGSRDCYDVEVYYRSPCRNNLVIQLYPCQKFYVGLKSFKQASSE